MASHAARPPCRGMTGCIAASGRAVLRIEPHRQAGLRHVRLGLAHRVLAEMEDRGRQHRGGVAVADALDQVIEVPTPPEAITGTGTASATARVSAMSKPDLVPSRSIEVSRISPAPSDDHLAA